ncbi:MAG: hypothetical protein GY771_05810 [bacterium]|nr:hypothetical protein [bacterium]
MKRLLLILIALSLVFALSAAASTPISVVVGPRVGVLLSLPRTGYDYAGYFEIGGKCDVVFEMNPLKGYLAITPTFDYGLNLEAPVILAGVAVKGRYPHHRFVPYAYFGVTFYSEYKTGDVAPEGFFLQQYGDSSGFLTTIGSGVDIRLTDLIAINAEFQALDFGKFISGLGGVSFFL